MTHFTNNNNNSATLHPSISSANTTHSHTNNQPTHINSLLNIQTFNIQGLNDPAKLASLINDIPNEKSILILTETKHNKNNPSLITYKTQFFFTVNLQITPKMELLSLYPKQFLPISIKLIQSMNIGYPFISNLKKNSYQIACYLLQKNPLQLSPNHHWWLQFLSYKLSFY